MMTFLSYVLIFTLCCCAFLDSNAQVGGEPKHSDGTSTAVKKADGAEGDKSFARPADLNAQVNGGTNQADGFIATVKNGNASLSRRINVGENNIEEHVFVFVNVNKNAGSKAQAGRKTKEADGSSAAVETAVGAGKRNSAARHSGSVDSKAQVNGNTKPADGNLFIWKQRWRQQSRRFIPPQDSTSFSASSREKQH